MSALGMGMWTSIDKELGYSFSTPTFMKLRYLCTQIWKVSAGSDYYGLYRSFYQLHTTLVSHSQIVIS